jgi:two-component system sensor histidine kinase/response regulator
MSKPVIVCIDDEPAVLDSLKIELKKALGSECTIETAEGGEDALELFQELLDEDADIALVLADYVMPGIKGDELLHRIHQLSPNTLTVMLTGQANLEAVGNAIRYAKLYRYIPKPWQPEDLKLTITEAIHSYLQDRKLEAQNLVVQQKNRELEELNAALEAQVYDRTLTLEREIQERQQAEIALQQKEQFLRSIYEGNAASIFIVDVLENGEFCYAGFNPAWERLTGLSSAQLQGSTPDQVLASTTAPLIQDHYRKCIEAGEIITYEECLPCQGQETWWITSLTPLRDNQSRIYRLIGTSFNITDRKQYEQALRASAEREQAITRVIEQMRQTLSVQTIFNTTTQELRQLLKCDRVVIYQFNLDWSGQFVSESVASGWTPLLQEQGGDPTLREKSIDDKTCRLNRLSQVNNPIDNQVQDTYLQDTQGSTYTQGTSYLCVEDIYHVGFSPCYINLLERFQARAYVTVPIRQGDQLWGLLAAYQNSSPRRWQEAEIGTIIHIATQMGVALQQAELLKQTQKQAQELRNAKDRADAANRSKSTFLANMSHELRTPLTAILGFTQLLNRDLSLNQDHRAQLDIILQSGEHLLELINDVLDLSKIDAGRMTLNETNFDLYHLLDSLQEMLQLKAESKGLQLIFERAPNVPQFVQTDEAKLRQVLINLLGNAIKFTHAGSVKLRVGEGSGTASLNIPFPSPQASTRNPQSSSTPCCLIFEVEDTGPGMSTSELEVLFDAFVQTKAGQGSRQGTGLGLSISHRFVQLMGGDIAVRSVPGEGSTFRFYVRVQQVVPSAMQTSRLNHRRIIGLALHEPTYRILVVEDQITNRMLVVKLLSRVGFEVVEATNGEEAIALWQEWSPDLILMDMQMPGIDGYEATRQIRIKAEEKRMQDKDGRIKPEDEKKQSTSELATEDSLHPSSLILPLSSFLLPSDPVIIALTASAFEEERSPMIAAGCDDYIYKPFKANDLLTTIAKHLGVRYIYDEERGANRQPERRKSKKSEQQPQEPSPQGYRTIASSLTAAKPLKSSDLEVLSMEWVIQFYYAAVKLSSEQCLHLIEQIPPQYGKVSDGLRGLVNNFQFDVLIELFQKTVSKDPNVESRSHH